LSSISHDKLALIQFLGLYSRFSSHILLKHTHAVTAAGSEFKVALFALACSIGYLPDFPVLSAGPTPRTPLDRWTFVIEGLVREPIKWSWEEFLQLPAQTFVVDIHCETKWSKLDTHW
jgi:Oxidoreductase molybdopterin binding domain